MRYAFENTLSRGPGAIIIWLAIVSAFLVLFFGIIYIIFGLNMPGEENMSFWEALWQSLMRSVDPGTVAEDEGWWFRIVGLLITIGGIFILSTLIGVLTSGLENKLDDLRKGRTEVLETGHTLILGWSSKIHHIISELIIANENQKKPRIVIMAKKNKIEMEDEIRAKVPDTQNTKIICRTGSPLDLTDLEIVNPHQAKSIIIISPESNSDTYVIKSVLAITNNPKRKKGKYHIVAEIRDRNNMEAAKLVGGDEALFILSPDVIARVTAQTCRQSGLSIIYTELLDYEGDEVYFTKAPMLQGKTFREVLFGYETSAVLGYMDAGGKVHLNPAKDYLLEKDDQIIAISEDDDTLIISDKKHAEIEEKAIVEKAPEKPAKEKNLILGWNERGRIIVRELDKYVAPNSEIYIVAELDNFDRIAEKVKSDLHHQQLIHRIGRTTERALLEKIDIMSFDNIILLSYEHIPVQESDAQTLITLLHLRNISEKSGKTISIVSEMCDVKNRELAEVTKADDFIISDNMISLMLSQLSENRHLQKVFDTLFDAEGSEIYLKDATDYIQTGMDINFYTVLESAVQKNEIALGYRLHKDFHNPAKDYGVIVNPDKSKKINFSDQDKIIILAED